MTVLLTVSERRDSASSDQCIPSPDAYLPMYLTLIQTFDDMDSVSGGMVSFLNSWGRFSRLSG